MSRLKSIKATRSVHDQPAPTTAWASMVAMLAARQKKAELDLKRRIKRRAVNQQTSGQRKNGQAANKKVSGRRRTQQTAA
ncbi:MAG: hypothetical protein H6R21_2378 [Proteobacteria bacterium]|nr:hypothetical protein [Pseudomonadota bacterium]